MRHPVDTIIEELAPYIGEHMSRSVVQGILARLGAEPRRATPQQLEALLHELGLGMNVFVGHHVSKKIIDALRRRLGLASKKAGGAGQASGGLGA
jgi:hypothetical protein